QSEQTTKAIKIDADVSAIRKNTIDTGRTALRIVRASKMLIMLRLKVRDFSAFSSTGNSLFAIADKHLESDSAYRRASAPLARGRWCPKAAPTIRIGRGRFGRANPSNVRPGQFGRDFPGRRA